MRAQFEADVVSRSSASVRARIVLRIMGVPSLGSRLITYLKNKATRGTRLASTHISAAACWTGATLVQGKIVQVRQRTGCFLSGIGEPLRSASVEVKLNRVRAAAVTWSVAQSC